MVRTSASSPVRSPSSRRNAPRGTRPICRMPANTIPTSTPFMRMVLREGDKSWLALSACQFCWFIYEPSCAKPPHSAKTPNARRRERVRRHGGGSHWTQPMFSWTAIASRRRRSRRGPWHPDHQHAGPPSALICRAIERAAAQRRIDSSRAPHRQSHPAHANRRVPRRRRGGLRRPEHRPLFRALDRAGQGRCAFHRAHAARGRCPGSRRNAWASPACGAEAARPMPGSHNAFRRPSIRLRRSSGEPARGGTLLQRPLRRLVSHESSVGQGRDPERLSAGGGRGRTRATE